MDMRLYNFHILGLRTQNGKVTLSAHFVTILSPISPSVVHSTSECSQKHSKNGTVVKIHPANARIVFWNNCTNSYSWSLWFLGSKIVTSKWSPGSAVDF
jgi:hypothetical protein